MTGPSGGAGELTARILALKGNVNFRFGRSVEIAAGITLGELFDAFVTLAAKAPQGALAKEVREALEICAVRSGNEGYWCLLCGASIKWPSEKQQMIHCQDCLLAAPPTPSKLPAPVSDDTIHHGMVAPAPAITSNAALTFKQGDYSCAVCGFGLKYPCEHWKQMILSSREAAAPKPAPLTPGADAIEAPSTEDAKLWQPACPHVATPAPGAERAAPRERITEYLANGGLFNPENMEHAKVRELLRDVREALAAAPPAPQPIETLVHQLTKVTMELEDTLTSLGKADSMITKLKDLIAERDRHASAERVREAHSLLASDLQYIKEIIAGWVEDERGLVHVHKDAITKAVAAAIYNLRALPPSTGEKSQ